MVFFIDFENNFLKSIFQKATQYYIVAEKIVNKKGGSNFW